MITNEVIRIVPEPELIFGGMGEDQDPRTGLKRHGPYHYKDMAGPSLSSVTVGIIGTVDTIGQAKKLLEKLQRPSLTTEPNRWLYADFPGFNSKTSIACSLLTSDIYCEKISEEFEIKPILAISNTNERIKACVELYTRKIENLKRLDDPPHVIICTLPRDLELKCGISEFTRGAKKIVLSRMQKLQSPLRELNQTFLAEWGVPADEDKPDAKGFDFRNSLKGHAMQYGIPTQILLESTAKYMIEYTAGSKKTRQDIASFLWNFGTALYYKASGKPWRLAKLRQDTCYVGISFYRSKIKPSINMETSMAQVFTEDGQGLVLNGSEVVRDKATKEVHLSEDQARNLLDQAITKYIETSKRNPIRVVVHKESSFNDAEKTGFNKAIQKFGKLEKDFVRITKNHSIRLARYGIYPVLRGSIIKFLERHCLLYTTGFSPRIRTYAGMGIPRPLLITSEGDSDIDTICEEILGLTKLNWNTTSFATTLPITLEFSKQVGNVLSEFSGKILLNHYRFYM